MDQARAARDVARIFVAENSSMQCELMSKALGGERGVQVVGMASDSRLVARLLTESEPDVALVSSDLQDGPGTGLKVLAEVQAKRLRTQCIMLLDRSDRKVVVDAFRKGARGVFFRAQSFELLRKCIRIILQGQIWLNTREMNYILEALVSPGSLQLVDGQGKTVLTQREAEVAHLVAEGLSNREIAIRLQLSEHTVKNYIFRIFDKTGVSNRVALVLYAFSQQEVAQPPSP
jgi:DNA-binding NarL/FixJ family response regulator